MTYAKRFSPAVLVLMLAALIISACARDEIERPFVGGEFAFESSRDLAANDGLRSVALGDLDGNGTTDVVVIDDGGFTVYLQDTSGTFLDGVTTAIGVTPQDVTLADMNSDGILDVVASNGSDATVSILNGSGDGTFEANEDDVLTGENPIRVYARDVDGDGIPDVITANRAGDSISAVLSGGAPDMDPPGPGAPPPPPPVLMGTPGEFSVNTAPSAIAFSDINGDSYLDLAVANEGSDSVTIMMNDGKGQFDDEGEFLVGDGPSAIAFADVNDDDIDDLIVSHRYSNDVYIILGSVEAPTIPSDYEFADGEEAFELGFQVYTPTIYSVGNAPNDLAVADIDHDGDLDVLTVDTISNTLSILLGGNNGYFSAEDSVSLAVDPVRLAAGFVDANNSRDVAVAINDSPTMITFLLGSDAIAPGPIATPQFDITTTTLADGVLSTAYAQTIATVNGEAPLAASIITGALPLGMSIAVNGTSIEVAGVPIESGTFTFEIQASDASTASDTQSYTIVINQTPPGPYANFMAGPPIAVGDEPLDVQVADLNGDGVLDLISANASTNNVTVALGNGMMGVGDGTFAAPASFGTGARPVSVAVGDVNNDGFADLVTANANGNNVSILLGDGMGMFATAVNFSSGGTLPRAVALGDFDGDTLLDIAVANFSTNTFALLLNTTTAPMVPSFASAVTRQDGAGTMSKPIDIQVADLDSDGNADVITANSGSNDLTTFMGDGAGGFSTGMNFEVGDLPKAVSVVDFNADGALDLISINELSGDGSVLLGNGVGGFAATVDTAIDGFAIEMAIADFDGDSNLDIASADFNGAAFIVVRGTGGAVLDNSTSYAAAGEPAAIATADFNGDGLPDLVVADSQNGLLVVYLNS